MKDSLHGLIELFFPNQCFVCAEPLFKFESGVCFACYTSLPEFLFHHLESNNVTKKIWGHADIHSGVSSFIYKKGNKIQQIIHGIKYAGFKQLADQLVGFSLSHKSLIPWISSMDYIIPVPLHKIKFLMRGFNQSMCIAKVISQKTNVPILPNVLKRNSFTFSQTTKNRDDRFNNMHRILRLNHTTDLQNRRILIVDDVLTTGATLSACIQELNKIKGSRISCYTLAVAE